MSRYDPDDSRVEHPEERLERRLNFLEERVIALEKENRKLATYLKGLKNDKVLG